MTLLHDWESIELEQALSLLGGFFSLNDEYMDLCVVQPPKEDQKKRFRKIKNVAI